MRRLIDHGTNTVEAAAHYEQWRGSVEDEPYEPMPYEYQEES